MIDCVTLEHVGQFGQGVGVSDSGRSVFVAGGYPGERVAVELGDGPQRYAEAKLVKVIQASPHRVTSPCPWFLECGGCDWLTLAYVEQVRLKQAMLAYALGRHADFVSPQSLRPILPAVEPLGYRSRIQLQKTATDYGFFSKRSHHLVPVRSCAIARPNVAHKISDSDFWQGMPEGRYEVEELSSGEVTVAPARRHALRLSMAQEGGAYFQQVHASQNRVLQAVVLEAACELKARYVVELFCGDGNLTWAYADKVEAVTAYEGSEAAVAQAQRELCRRGSEGAPMKVVFVLQSIHKAWLRRMWQGPFGQGCDTLVLDPPRQGMSTGVLPPHVRSLVGVFCRVPSFLSSLAEWHHMGFRVVWIQPIDMFPQTRHLELVCALRR